MVGLILKCFGMTITKIVVDNGFVEVTKANLVLCDASIIWGLPCVLSMLEFVHGLMKFVQAKDVFMCDYILIIKIYQFDLYI
jgi:hypothetical protein